MSVADQSVPVANSTQRVPFTVRFSSQFVNRLCARLQRSAPPRSEVAGLLFGHSREGLLEVQVFKSFPENEGDGNPSAPQSQANPQNQLGQQNQSGPARDLLHGMVEASIASSRKDPEVSALELVGWYSFRPTGGLHESDIAFHNRYFRQPTEIALILRPEQHPNVLFELYSRSGTTLLSEEEHRWGSLRHPTDLTVSGPLDVTMRANISDDFYLRAYHVGKTLDRAERRDHWAGAVEATKSTMRFMFRPKPKRAGGLGLGDSEKQKPPVAAEAATPAAPLTRAAAAAASEPAIESKPAVSRMPEAALPPSAPFTAPKPREREAPSPRAASSALKNIRAGDPPNLPAVIREKRRRVPWLSSVIVGAIAAGFTFAIYLRSFPGGETPQFLRALFPDTGLGLKIEGQGDRVLLSWNRHNAVVQSAKGALLHIEDGAQRRDIRLDPSQVANGAVLYRPGSDDVSFHLEIHGSEGATVAGTMRVLDGAKTQPLEVKNAPPEVSGSTTAPTGSLPSVVATTQPRSPREGVTAAPSNARVPYRPAASSYNAAERAVAEDRAPVRTSAATPAPTSAAPARDDSAATPTSAVTASRPTAVSAPPPVSSAESRPPSTSNQTFGQTASSTTGQGAGQTAGQTTSETTRPPDTAKVSNWEDTLATKPGSAGKPRGADATQPTAVPNPAAAQPTSPFNTGTSPGGAFVPPRPMKQVLPDLSSSGPIGATSQVEVAVRVNKKGHVTDAFLVGNTSGIAPRLASAAVGAAKQWTFEPATLRGKTVPSDHTIVFEFRPPGR